ncbi:MAG: hypothetical protein JNK21_12860 [Rhodospirillaceae bacterium]|nr:hypothetical protein [Rhodospirillaceae bacterium]
MSKDKVYDTDAVVDALISDPARRDRHHFIDTVDMDRVVTALLRLAMEISVLRDRIDTHESLAAKTGAYTRGDVDTYRPSPEEDAARAERRKQLVARLTRDLAQ